MLRVLQTAFTISFGGRFTLGALVTFLVTVADVAILNVGAPFWGLVLGVAVRATGRRGPLEAAVRAVFLYRKLIASQPTVFIGDTNSNAIWDAQREEDRLSGVLDISGTTPRSVVVVETDNLSYCK